MSNAITVRQKTANPAMAYLAGLRSEVGRRSMRSRLVAVARALGANDIKGADWSALTAQHVQTLISQMDGSPATINTTRAALRGVAKAAWRLGAMSRETLDQINDIGGARGSRLAAGRDVPITERAQLLAVCKASAKPIDQRDAAMLAMVMATGMRREELVTLAMADLKPEEDLVAVRVQGKGNKEREVYVSGAAVQALEIWLGSRGRGAGALFCYVTRGSRVVCDHHISTAAASKRLERRAKAAGITNVGWHDFRRTYAGDMLDTGTDISTLAGLMGHSDVRTTQRYDRRPRAIRKAAAARIKVPF